MSDDESRNFLSYELESEFNDYSDTENEREQKEKNRRKMGKSTWLQFKRSFAERKFAYKVVIYILSFIFIALIALWVWLSYTVNSVLIKSFSWEGLLKPMGSTFDDCDEAYGPQHHRYKLFNNCPFYYSVPWVGIVAVILLIPGLLIFNLIKGTTVLFVLLGFSHAILLTVGGPIVGHLYTKNLRGLKEMMKEDMGSSLNKVTLRWDLVQVAMECCGIESGRDWFFPDAPDKFPNSCCNTTVSGCLEAPTFDRIWQTGCFPKEESNLRFYGTFEILLLCFGSIYTLFCVSIFGAFDCLEKDAKLKDKEKERKREVEHIVKKLKKELVNSNPNLPYYGNNDADEVGTQYSHF